jgi:UDP-glucuronate 4-epimerase
MGAVLVTGGAGFIGSHVVDRLLAETRSDVVVLDDFNDYYDAGHKRANLSDALRQPRVRLVEGSLGDSGLLAQVFAADAVEVVLHLGGYAGVTPSLTNPELYFRVNVAGTQQLLSAARQHGVRRFVFASSSTVYGCGAVAPFREDAPLGAPLSPYGASKQMAETLVAMYHDVFALPTVRLRFFNVYGPRLRPDLALAVFVRCVLTGEPLPLYGDGTVRRDFTHVDDVCRAILAAMETPAAVGEAINVGHDKPVEIREVIRLVEAAAGRQANIKSCPPRGEDMPLTHADLSKARRLLSYEPRIALEQGIAEYVTWYREENSATGGR